MRREDELSLYQSRAATLRNVSPGAGAHELERLRAVRDVVEYWQVLRKRGATVLAVLGIVFAIVVLATFKQKKIYEARTLLEIQKENPDVPTLEELFQIEGVSDAYLETQDRILKSENLARRVIAQLRLDRLPEFGAKPNSAREVAPQRRAYVSSGAGEATKETLDISDEVLKRFEDRLTVAPVKRSRLIEVTFESTDPQLAAKVVNTLASEYMEQNLESRWDASRKASEWLSEQLTGMKATLERSEEELQHYAHNNGLLFLETDKGGSENIVVQRLREVQDELTKARDDLYEKESLWRLLQQSDQATVPGVSDNKLTQDLSEKLAELKRERSRLSATFNPEYPRVKELQSEIDESESVLDAERKRAAEQVSGEFRAALERESLLESEFDREEKQAGDVAQKSVQYNILKREAETNKQLYVGLLEKLKETGVSTSLKATNVRVVDVAYPPKKFARPKIALNLSMGFLLGLCFAVGAAFLQEYLDNTLKSAEEVEQFLRLPALGSVPIIESAENGKALQALYTAARLLTNEKRPDAAAHWNRIETNGQQTAALAEAFHGLRTSVLLSTAKRPPASMLVTSAQPGEGKTTVAANLAISLAQLSEPVLLIDADLRRPSLGKFFGAANESGLVNYLTGHGDWRDLVCQAGGPGLSVLFCGPVPPNPTDLISSEYMRSLVRDAEREYKFVILDSPPLLNLADSRVLATLVDGVILVIGGGSTPRELVHRAYVSVLDAGSHVLGAAINFADAKADYYYSGYQPGKNGTNGNGNHGNGNGRNKPQS